MQEIKNTPTRIPRSKHTFSRRNMSPAALNVLYQLHKAGYQAFLVGGGVRDILLGRIPKDFDVVTNALPEQIRSLFRSCHLIGRRFVLAHVRLNKEIVEVATFRAHHDKGSGGGMMEDGRIVRDNVYGSTVDDDAWRRDFTINALYYDISDFSLLDYAEGMTDLREGVIRLIGKPEQRYKEDPVRMLRAIRFAAKLNFTIAPSTIEPIPKLADLLADIPPARLFEEVLKLFLSGHAVESFVQLRQYGLFKQLFPYTEACLDDPVSLALIEQGLHITDKRTAGNKPVTPAFLLATLLWPVLSRSFPDQHVKGINRQEMLLEASQQTLAKQQKYVTIPRRISVLIQEIWLLQVRLTRQRRGKRFLNVIEHPRFRAGYDFLVLRANTGEEKMLEFSQWWTQYLTDNKSNQELSQKTSSKKHPRRKQKSKQA
ncbi:polynucleotide adenylyltransferase PcnB [Candidatus Parabeggiatoa sp. HSG14]|uniref:polynucleotide adenylyltransferase PcnB n=1 Tax=Candidatus Parabeggiatoa sp. HSG14 TaxID=3055593 RepID=UPI0025A71F40|nr:polynucleotide adenylyltransferase PcnB [Thiotrichales bacterium HSG14]